MGQLTFRAYSQYEPLTKKQVKVEAAKLRRRLADVLFDRRSDPDEVWLAARDAWHLLGHVARRTPSPKKQNVSDLQIVAAARQAAKAAETESAALGKLAEILGITVEASKKRLERLGHFDR